MTERQEIAERLRARADRLQRSIDNGSFNPVDELRERTDQEIADGRRAAQLLQAPALTSEDRDRLREAVYREISADKRVGLADYPDHLLIAALDWAFDQDQAEPEGIGFEHCKRCGRGNTIWHAPSPLWNAVMRGGSIDGDPLYGDLVCATCFMELAEQRDIASGFKVLADRVNVELETTTPSGRVWDDERQLWTEPPDPQCEGSGESRAE